MNIIVKIACQTITFGSESHKKDLKDVIKIIANAGYDGMETGFMRVDANEAQNYKEWQWENNIKQAGIHIGGDFSDEETVKKQCENIPPLVKFAHILDCKHIFFSGSPIKNYKAAAENLNNFGKILSEEGLVFSYHNHDWEIKENCFGLYTIYDNTDPKYVSFVPDVGWIVRGGANPVEVLKRLGARVSNLHFKEFTSDGQFTELGKGVVNFKEIYNFIKDRDMWIIAEQDVSVIGAEASVTQNCEYIKSLM